jgi:hypothetical protein
MRRVFVIFALVGSAAALAPLAAAPAETESPSMEHRPAVAVQQVSMPGPGLRDEAGMVLVGTALIVLGAAVRRSAQ